MANKKDEREQVSYSVDKEQLMLQSSYEMYERSIKSTEEHLRAEIDKNTGERVYSDEDIADRVGLLRDAQKDIVEKYVKNGGKAADLKAQKTVTKRKTRKKILDSEELVSESIKENSVKKETPKVIEEEPIKNSVKNNIIVENNREKTLANFIPTSYNHNTSFDIIPLPSKGECYSEKIDKIPVSYLTAYDENIIISPNLYKENMVIDYILSEKIMNDDIDPSMLLDGDRDAIILYLRAAGYGNEYPITVTDDRTGEEFSTVVDLSELKFKEFNLVGDENGYFDFELPVSKSKVKFKFLNHRDNKVLQELNLSEKRNGYKDRLMSMTNEIERIFDDIKSVDAQSKIKAREDINGLKDFINGMKDNTGDDFTHILTNKLELSIISIDGNTDRKFIRKFIHNMNVMDSIKLRKYITENEPGIDFNMTVQRPESLGGGSMNVFLELDQYVFLNVPE